MHDPVVIAAFRSAGEAATARAALQAGGIEAEAAERAEGIERRCADAFAGGIDVIVEGADADRGIALLQHLWPDDAIDAQLLDRCKVCGSLDVFRVPRLRLFLYVAIPLLVASFAFDQRDLFLLAIAIVGAVLSITPRRRCRACGERW